MKTRKLAVLLALAAACGQESSTSRDQGGALAVALTNVPAQVQCLQIAIGGPTRTASRMFQVSAAANQTITLHLAGLPTGAVTAVANAFTDQSDCSIIGPETPAAWVSSPTSATLVPGVEGKIALVLYPNGRAGVSVSFEGDEVDVTTLIGASGQGAPPVPDIGKAALSGGFDARAGTGGGMRAVLADGAQHVLWLFDDGQGKGGSGQPSVTVLGGTLGNPGFADGPLQGAAFDDPEGGATSLRPIWNPPNSGGFVADTGNCAVREVDLDGTGGGMVTTRGPHGCGGGPVDGPAESASLAGPRGIETATLNGGGTFSRQLILISDGNAIRAIEVDPATGKATKVTTVAGDGLEPGAVDDPFGPAARFNGPRGLAWDGAKTLYVADEKNHAIRALDLIGGGVRTVAGQLGLAGHADGAASNALLDSPRGVAMDPMGALIITQGDGTIRRLQAGVLVTMAGTPGKPGQADGDGASALFSSLGQGFTVAMPPTGDPFIVADGARLRRIDY
jgi:hypothetical protein